jgi:DNA mismatch repair protein MutL
LGIISVLDKQLADLIAAGEVVGRASSVIKELLENSIDAGAKNITVEIKGGGNIYMRVSDDGSGIMKDDAEIAFLRHATSKIKKNEDLGNIATLGFRGEALAAICAVSRLELITKTKDDDLGIAIKFEGGSVISRQDAGCPNGTTIIVRDLFYNTPARLKFIKKDSTEAGHIFDIIQKIAMARPDIGFKLIKDSKEVLFTTGDGILKNVIYSIFGKEFAQNLIEVDYENFLLRVSGFITSPQYYKNNKNYQNFFINKRYIKSPLLTVALSEAYKGSLISERYPGCILNLSVPYSSVDVNVDPSKLNVKFSNEKAVYDVLYFGVKTAINSYKNTLLTQGQPKRPIIIETKQDDFVINVTPKNFAQINKTKESFELNQTGLIADQPQIHKQDVLNEKSLLETIESLSVQKQNNDTKQPRYTNKLLDIIFNESDTEEKTKPKPDLEIKEQSIQKPIFLGEAFSVYILAQRGDELFLIDKHAAHERIIYEQIKGRAGDGTSQLLLEPVVLTLTPLEYDAFLQNKKYFADVCFEIEDFGKNSVIVRQVPYDINISELEDLITQILNDFCENKNQVYDKMLDKLYMSVACKAAIKANNKN